MLLLIASDLKNRYTLRKCNGTTLTYPPPSCHPTLSAIRSGHFPTTVTRSHRQELHLTTSDPRDHLVPSAPHLALKSTARFPAPQSVAPSASYALCSWLTSLHDYWTTLTTLNPCNGPQTPSPHALYSEHSSSGIPVPSHSVRRNSSSDTPPLRHGSITTAKVLLINIPHQTPCEGGEKGSVELWF